MSLINPRFGRPGHDRRYAPGETIHEIGDEIPVRAEAPPVAPPPDAVVKGITMRREELSSPKAANSGHDAPPVDDGYIPPGEADGVTQKRFELIPFDKIKIDTAPAYLVKGIAPRVGLCIVWGPPKCGKSFLVLDMMMHVALGWKYRERKVRQGAVVYCALEGCTAFKNRVEAFRHEKLADNASAVPFSLMASPMQLVADHLALVASIRERATAPAAVVIDTLNRSLTGSESSDEDMSAYVLAADAVRDAFNCAVIIVHHCGHEGTRPRGHSSLIGALDAQIAVMRDAAHNVVATVELMKDGAQGDEFTSRLDVVEVGIDDDGDPITSCVIVPLDGLAQQKEKPKKLPAAAAKALKALHEIIDDAGAIPPADPYIPPATKAVTVEQWREHALKRGISGGDGRKLQQQAFRRAFDILMENNRIAVCDPYAWPLASR
jgi:AAA domain